VINTVRVSDHSFYPRIFRCNAVLHALLLYYTLYSTYRMNVQNLLIVFMYLFANLGSQLVLYLMVCQYFLKIYIESSGVENVYCFSYVISSKTIGTYGKKKHFHKKTVFEEIITLNPVLWIRNYFFRIRIPFSTEFWIRIRILLD
jgi:hypothetical protein